ncbi:hypothetical protein EMPS_01220 [Entomortierella parvispora]|uniref:Uncharacterized protein n=1 Tax=Entomortierella parvispora TaxID=205924 RepID=A0A9P3LSH2_9FUNG|nr:hypothetical protein EMPS_01220 [Entomortierella parvispora]
MSNSNSGMQDITTAGSAQSGSQSGQGQSSHRNVQFRVSAAQQQQLQQHHQQQQHQHQHQQQQDQQQQSSAPPPDSTGLMAAGSLPPTNHSSRQSQSFHYQEPSMHQLMPQHGMAYSQSSSQIYQQSQSQQQRPPIAPTLQPRLHHSASAGNIAMVASSNRMGGMVFEAGSTGGVVGGAGVGAVVMPKKKDPYATAWRTYSKIAEELNLLNPDGTLYPISKEAILKYLHHQSKRIKSSNLHWYVNGLKKHQENLGFPWDDVRYDEQVVGLLRELTLHPVMMTENGDDDGHGHAYGSQANRQRQPSGGAYSSLGGGGRAGHHYSSSSIDTTQIANLSISQRPHPSLQQQSYSHQQQQPPTQQRPPYQQPQRTQSSKQQQQQQQIYAHHSASQAQSQQRLHQHQHQMVPQKAYSTPTPVLMPSHHARTPSGQELSFRGHSSLSHGSSSVIDSHGSHLDSFNGLTPSALSKRKRDESVFKKRRIPTSTSVEGEEAEEDDLQEDDLREDDEDLEERQPHGVDEFDDMDEDPNRYQPLKRRASTGTLLNQARASAVKHVPGPYGSNNHGTGSVLYQKPVHHGRAGEAGSTSALPPHYHTPSRSRDLRSPSPDLMQDESSAGFAIRRRDSIPRVRDSPPESTSSNSSASSHPSHVDHRSYLGHRPTHHFRPSDGDQLQQQSRLHHHRHTSSSGSALAISPRSASEIAPLPLSTRASSSNSGPATRSLAAPGKNTVQFSEVAEYAQMLQVKYGTRCKEHPWGCVEIASGQHLELTIKMYLDWAGLVASGRLTMDELPDLPEFRIVHSGSTAHSLGGTLRRMASTPFTRPQSSKATPTTNEDSIMTTAGSNTRASVGPYRSPSTSPPMPTRDKDMVTDNNDNILSRIGSSSTSIATSTGPVRIDSTALRSISSPPSHHSSGSGRGLMTGIDDETKEDPSLRRPRKISSTPSLHQAHGSYMIRMSSLGPLSLHDQQQQQSNVRSRERRQRMQSSPRSAIGQSDEDDIDGRDESDNDDLDKEEEDEDSRVERRRAPPASNQYALDPWSLLRGSSAPSLRRTTTGSTPDFTARRDSLAADTAKKSLINFSSSVKELGQESPSSSAMEVEQEVAEIGLISEAPVFDTIERTQMDSCSQDATGEDQTNMIVVEGSAGSAVDAAAMVLDSMKIGRTTTTTTTTTMAGACGAADASGKQHTMPDLEDDTIGTTDLKDKAEGTLELRTTMTSG